MRDWLFIDKYYQELLEDIYDQPEDVGHSTFAKRIIDKWAGGMGIHSVVDMGCGTGFCAPMFRRHGIKEYLGISKDFESKDPLILNVDFNFSGLPDSSFDLVFSRHSLEHSPFPLFTLMEWHRIAVKYLILVLPNPEHYTYIGRNHYSVMPAQQARWLLRRSGWKLLHQDEDKMEIRYMCTKESRLGFEGYLERLDSKTYTIDRDGKPEG